MEYVDGANLRELLRDGKLTNRDALSFVPQICDALQFAHDRGVVHRDIKPENILIAPSGECAKLMDFGIAHISDLGEFKSKVFESSDGGVSGTPEYLSPEAICGDPVRAPGDLYAIGITLFRMLAGRLPFKAETVGGWIKHHIHTKPPLLSEAVPNAQFPPQLTTLIERLLIKNPEERLQSAGAALELLNVLLEQDLASGRNTRHFKPRRDF